MAEVRGLAIGEVMRRVGDLSQVARVDSFTEDQGPARGSRRLRLVTGGGLEVEIHPDRAMDLGNVTFDGVPVAWLSPTGIANPAFFEPRGSGWLRTFGGGLLATCGLDTFGPASTDGDTELGLHGRIGTTPARLEVASVGPQLTVQGVVRQARVFGENLELRRTITADLGGTVVRLQDAVTNCGTAPSPHMILYHFNLGWPLVDQATVLSIPATVTAPRDADAAAGISAWSSVHAPVAGMREQVFVHRLAPETEAVVRVEGPPVGIGVELAFDTGMLPCLYQWKMLAEGTYVLGLEPSNTPNLLGRAAARASGELPALEPGETRLYRIALSFVRLPGNEGAAVVPASP